VRLARGIQNEIGASMPNYKSPFMPSPWQFTGGSSTKSMLKKASKGLTTDIAALTTLSANLQSAFGSVVRTWYIGTPRNGFLRVFFFDFSGFS
jgi:hypothetical protein